jgi:hypothetical protein
MSIDASSGPPAGWYDDPSASGARRYWTGTAWAPVELPAGHAVAAPSFAWSSAATPMRNGIGVWAFVLGLVALVLFWVPLLYLLTSIAGGIVAIVLGVRGRRLAATGAASNGSLATTGMVLGIIGLSLAGLSGIVGAIAGAMSAIS